MEKSFLKLHFLEYCFQLTIARKILYLKTLFLRCKLTFPLFDLDILLEDYHILDFPFFKMEFINYLKNY